MSWLPIGPRFVFAPRDTGFQRLSRRNEWGAQAVVAKIAIEPGNPEIIYVVIRPSSGGIGLYRSSGAGTASEDWISIVDPSQPNGLNGASIGPSCVAIDPVTPSTIYMGTFEDQSIYVSLNRGQTWVRGVAVGASVRKLVIDPRTAGNPNNTVIYAATNQGLFRSPDSGMHWVPVPGLKGLDVWSFCASMPPNGPDAYYAGVFRAGLYTASDTTGLWTNLNAQPNLGLPAYNAAAPGGENFNVVYADLCPLDPSRVYLVLLSGTFDFNVALYMSDNATSAWSQVPIGAVKPWAYDPFNEFNSFYGIYDFAFAVAPNSPGKAAAPANKDILFFADGDFWRSIDGGITWVATANSLHIDHHAFAFDPANAPAATIPTVYFGTDGGLGASTHFCDPAVDISVLPSDFDELDVYSNSSGAVQNYNHGISAVAIRDYATHAAISALQYIAANDTSIAAGEKTGVWRGLSIGGTPPPPSGDDAMIAIAPGADGVKAWCLVQADPPPWPVYMFTDHGDFSPPSQQVLSSTGQTVTNTGNPFVVTPDNKCVFPMQITDASGNPVHSGVGLIDQNAVAGLISQDFSPSFVLTVGVGSTADPGYCGTSDNRVWFTPSVKVANAATVWTEIANSRPAGIVVWSIAVDASNAAYVFAQSPVTSGGVTTPLFKVSGGLWEPQTCPNAPNVRNFGRLLADPVQAGVLYTQGGGHVYRLSLAGGTWNWQDISDDLPGQDIFKMWIGNIGSSTSPKVILRAAIPSRGVWELDTSSPMGPLPISLYLRDNFLDQGLLPISPDGVPSPYAPTDPTQRVVHWRCADIKVDAQQVPGGGKPNFFQTDPEGNISPNSANSPISAIAFDCINDNSAHLPTTDAARVHVQVHNRSLTPANNVLVWAIYAPAAGHPPSLAKNPPSNNFNFWSQFTVSPTGVAAISPALPSNSPWYSVGPPITLNGVDATHPQVASWNWTVPLLSSGDPGHYCIVAFVHSADNPLVENIFDVDTITPLNRLVGQKNLHIGPPLVWRRGLAMREYVEFNNPYRQAKRFDLSFDFRSLPKEFVVSLQLTALDTSEPLQRALGGIASSRPGTLVLNSPAREEEIRARRHRLIQLPKFVETIYRAEASARVFVKGVDIPAFGQVAAFLSIHYEGGLPQAAQYHVMIEQIGAGETAGGSTYVVRIAGGPAQSR